MSDLLTIRLPENEKDALAFSSHLSEMPVSKVILPFISEGVHISLGALLLHRIDRSTVFRRENYERFIDMIVGSTSGVGALSEGVPEDFHEILPRIVWNFFELMSETKAVQRINSDFDDVEVTMDTTFILPDSIKSLCRSIGASYLSFGGSLDSMNYQLANDIFFKKMLHMFYKANARGTSRALSTQWYANQSLISKLAGEMNDRYMEHTGGRSFEAIEVTGKKKRGRPAKKKKRSLPAGPQLIAREIK
ncbi:MAG: hypothetical protein R6V01_00190 [Thermoplasmatota archaeon]